MKPNPGSPEAVEQGCGCPVSDNNNGQGFPWQGSKENVFWITSECPLHGQPIEEEKDELGTH